jgi:hypothetical protein
MSLVVFCTAIHKMFLAIDKRFVMALKVYRKEKDDHDHASNQEMLLNHGPKCE